MSGAFLLGFMRGPSEKNEKKIKIEIFAPVSVQSNSNHINHRHDR